MGFAFSFHMIGVSDIQVHLMLVSMCPAAHSLAWSLLLKDRLVPTTLNKSLWVRRWLRVGLVFELDKDNFLLLIQLQIYIYIYICFYLKKI